MDENKQFIQDMVNELAQIMENDDDYPGADAVDYLTYLYNRAKSRLNIIPTVDFTITDED